MTATENWYAEDAATFGDRLAAAREAAGLTQAELAKRIHANPSKSTGDQERDQHNPNDWCRRGLIGGLHRSIGR